MAFLIISVTPTFSYISVLLEFHDKLGLNSRVKISPVRSLELFARGLLSINS